MFIFIQFVFVSLCNARYEFTGGGGRGPTLATSAPCLCNFHFPAPRGANSSLFAITSTI